MEKDIFLYLRPFTSDGVVRVNNPERSFIRNLIPTAQFGTESTITVEELMLQAVRKNGSLVAIGQTVEMVGAGKIIANDLEWEAIFKSVSRRAKCILSVPSQHKSTLWELDWIAGQSLFSRVMMIFTELHFGEENSHYSFDSLSQRLRQIGWRLPSDTQPSSIVTFNATGEVRTFYRNTRYRIGSVKRGVIDIISNNRN